MSVAAATSNGSPRFRRVAWAPTEGTEIALNLPARAENVSLVRHTLGGIAGPLGMDEEAVAGMRLAVTEACTNVVRHAYHGGVGPLEVVMRPHPDDLEIIVSDFGAGVGPSPDVNGPGLGLPLIAALSDRLDVQHAPNAGTRLAMAFSLDGTRA